MSCPNIYDNMVLKKCCCLHTSQDPHDTNDRGSRYTIYILLLGAAETGKSTIMRQMKIIDSGKMTPHSLRSYTNHILKNVLTCLTKLVAAVTEAAIPWASPESSHAADLFRHLKVNCDEEINLQLLADHGHLIELLWNDEASQQCWNRANEFSLPDSTAYFLNAANRLCAPYYTPSQEDVLRMRLPTVSANVYDFVNGNWTLRVTDVGGQRGERRRWIRLFDGIHGIIFLAALSEYDQIWKAGEEDDLVSVNRLELSLRLFKETLGFPGFDQTSIILFLNKTDVLEQKVATSDLVNYFPTFTGARGDATAATNFIRDRFVELGKEKERHIYWHETCATDTEKTRFVYTAVREQILYINIGNIFVL